MTERQGRENGTQQKGRNRICPLGEIIDIMTTTLTRNSSFHKRKATTQESYLSLISTVCRIRCIRTVKWSLSNERSFSGEYIYNVKIPIRSEKSIRVINFAVACNNLWILERIRERACIAPYAASVRGVGIKCRR